MAAPRTPTAWDLIVVAAIFLVVVGGMTWLLPLLLPTGKPSRVVAIVADGDPRQGAYVGQAACQDCHPGEYAHFTNSGHARTLRVAAERRLAEALDGRTVGDPERPGVSWSYLLRDGRLFVERGEGGRTQCLPIDYAFGSGYHATTFLTLTDPTPDRPRALEHRLTHYSADDSLGITPGQGAFAGLGRDDPLGYELTPRETLKCFGCHATRTSAEGPDRLDPATMIPNVTCERCHGPGRAHVEAALRGDGELSMPFGLGSWTADEQIALCGQCHRHPSNAPPGLITPENRQIARFQPVGILQSRCYTEAGGTFSCVTCHDPHARSKSDRVHYESICLDCHGGPPTPEPFAVREVGCVDCHMPRVDSGQGVLFTDHWIRARRELRHLGSCTRPDASPAEADPP